MDSLHPRSLAVSAREAGSGGGPLLWGLRGPPRCAGDRDPSSRVLHGGMCQTHGRALSTPRPELVALPRGEKGTSPTLRLFLSDASPLSAGFRSADQGFLLHAPLHVHSDAFGKRRDQSLREERGRMLTGHRGGSVQLYVLYPPNCSAQLLMRRVCPFRELSNRAPPGPRRQTSPGLGLVIKASAVPAREGGPGEMSTAPGALNAGRRFWKSD